MNYEEDFVDETPVEFEIEGRKFKYKPTTAGEENKWVNEYIEVDEEGKLKQNLEKVNQCKIRNLVEVPYSKELIKEKLKIEKEWKDLNKEERWKLLQALKPIVFNKIISNINEIDLPSTEVKK